jgi:hypothetical protein
MPTIVLERRPSDVMAYLKGNKAVWGCGRSATEAIGDVVLSHADAFGLVVEVDLPSFERYQHVPLSPK